MNICPVCKQPSGVAKSGNQKIYCSFSCQILGRKNGQMVPCACCGKQFYKCPSQKEKKYCSRTCNGKISGKKNVRKNGTTHICPVCSNEIYIVPSTLKERKNGIVYCSQVCKIRAMKNGDTNYGFKDCQADKRNNRYPRIQVDGKRVFEHRHLMEKKLGRKLLTSEIVHHINGNPKDNGIENLTIVSSSEHGSIHVKDKILPLCTEKKDSKD